MPRQTLLELLLRQFQSDRQIELEELSKLEVFSGVPIADLKSAILTLLRRQDIVLTDNFSLAKAGERVAA